MTGEGLGALGGAVVILAALVTLVYRQGEASRRILRERVDDLEAARAADREECDDQIAALQSRLDTLESSWADRLATHVGEELIPAVRDAAREGARVGVIEGIALGRTT